MAASRPLLFVHENKVARNICLAALRAVRAARHMHNCHCCISISAGRNFNSMFRRHAGAYALRELADRPAFAYSAR